MRGGELVKGHWCILRTSGASTLPLAESLAKAGFEVWTPSQALNRRRPRSNAKFEIVVPLMPSYVFARADRIGDLVALSRTPIKRHRSFTVFRYLEKYPLVSDRSLDHLRTAERRGVPLAKARSFEPGEEVRFSDAGFEGLPGIVETTKGKYTMVCFASSNLTIKIASWKLLPVHVQDTQPEQGNAAQTASAS